MHHWAFGPELETQSPFPTSLKPCNDMIGRTTAVGCAALALGAALTVTARAQAATALTVESEAGMVVTSQHLASEVDAAVLRQGGNAIDAAVAVGVDRSRSALLISDAFAAGKSYFGFCVAKCGC